MTTLFWILAAGALGFGIFRFFKLREKRESERQARAEKRAKAVRDDAHAMQRTLNGRR